MFIVLELARIPLATRERNAVYQVPRNPFDSQSFIPCYNVPIQPEARLEKRKEIENTTAVVR